MNWTMYQAKKAFTAYTMTYVSRRTNHPTMFALLSALAALLSSGVVVTTYTSSLAAAISAVVFFSPNPSDLSRIRQDIDTNYDQWNKILRSKTIASNFVPMAGDKVATAPRSYDTKHPAIGLLRHKQFILRHYFTDAEVIAPDFLKEVNKTFKAVRPFFDHMSEVLTTDLNGELIV